MRRAPLRAPTSNPLFPRPDSGFEIISSHFRLMDSTTTRDRIRALNDDARRHLTDGRVYFTRGVAALPEEDQAAILDRVCAFDQFTPDNDPYGEHDFGTFEHNGERIFWKIDLYDKEY